MCTPLLMIILGLKAPEFPQELAEQNARASELIRDIIKKVLGRDEPFTLTVRKSGQRRYAKDTMQVLLPPIEVEERANFNLDRPSQCDFILQVRLTIMSAQELRSKGVALARARTEGFCNVYFGQCTTLSTRVRCEVTNTRTTSML